MKYEGYIQPGQRNNFYVSGLWKIKKRKITHPAIIFNVFSIISIINPAGINHVSDHKKTQRSLQSTILFHANARGKWSWKKRIVRTLESSSDLKSTGYFPPAGHTYLLAEAGDGRGKRDNYYRATVNLFPQTQFNFKLCQFYEFY